MTTHDVARIAVVAHHVDGRAVVGGGDLGFFGSIKSRSDIFLEVGFRGGTRFAWNSIINYKWNPLTLQHNNLPSRASSSWAMMRSPGDKRGRIMYAIHIFKAFD